MSLNPPLRDWRGQRVWLVGAGHGIGAALARAVHAAGAQVAISGRTRSALDEVAAACPGMQVLPLDVTQLAQWQRARDALLAAWGGIDMLVLLAADYQPVRAWELDSQRAAATLDVNINGVLHGVAANLATLMQQQGRLVLVASVAGWAGMPNALVYGASKAAVNHLAQTLYLDLHDKGVAVHVVNPGFVATRLTARNHFAMPALLTPPQAATAIMKGLAAGRFDIHFPGRFTWPLKLAAHLPYRLYFWLARKVTKA